MADGFDYGSNFDLGSFEDLAAVDALNNIDLSNIDFGSNFDLGSFEDLAAVDALSGLDLSNLDFGSNFDLGSFEDMAAVDALSGLDLGNVDFGSNFDLGSFEDLEAVDLGNRLAEFSQYNQDFGGADLNKYMDEYQSNLQDIYDKGGFTSQWQDVDGRKVQVYDDGTGMAINPTTGASKSLSESEVQGLINKGKLNTYQSGYNTATGGTKTAPGGGTSVTLKDGSKGTLMPNGRVIDDRGTVIGSSGDVKTTTTPGMTGTKTGTGIGAGGQQKSDLASLLPLLLMLLAANRGGSSGASSAVIPALSATQRQTPYTQLQQAPGYRPGQGGITYFNPVQYSPRMAAGGGIASLDRGRLLDGPGDGVSDSIPAMIDGMAEGGQPARLARYTDNYRTLVSGMTALGLRPFLRPEVQAPIIVTFHAPAHPKYDFKRFYESAKARGFILYPGKLTQVETFRVGCIGAIGRHEMQQAVQAVAHTLQDMGIPTGNP